jgi:hypothetical protein
LLRQPSRYPERPWCSLVSLGIDADDAVLDGEIVKLDEIGRPQFYDLMRRRGPFAFVAFDMLALSCLRCAHREPMKRVLVVIARPGASPSPWPSAIPLPKGRGHSERVSW